MHLYTPMPCGAYAPYAPYALAWCIALAAWRLGGRVALYVRWIAELHID